MFTQCVRDPQSGCVQKRSMIELRAAPPAPAHVSTLVVVTCCFPAHDMMYGRSYARGSVVPPLQPAPPTADIQRPNVTPPDANSGTHVQQPRARHSDSRKSWSSHTSVPDRGSRAALLPIRNGSLGSIMIDKSLPLVPVLQRLSTKSQPRFLPQVMHCALE